MTTISTTARIAQLEHAVSILAEALTRSLAALNEQRGDAEQVTMLPTDYMPHLMRTDLPMFVSAVGPDNLLHAVSVNRYHHGRAATCGAESQRFPTVEEEGTCAACFECEAFTGAGWAHRAVRSASSRRGAGVSSSTLRVAPARIAARSLVWSVATSRAPRRCDGPS